jgi:hypothetical protein
VIEDLIPAIERPRQQRMHIVNSRRRVAAAFRLGCRGSCY